MPTIPHPFPKSTKSTKSTRATIKFGSWLRLYSEDQLLTELAAFGFTRATFRHFLSNLCVPTLRIGKLRFVDGYCFFLALRAVLAIGEPDFHAPGSQAVANRNVKASRLDLDRFRLNQKRLTADLLYSKRFNGLHLTDFQIRKTARLALGRIQANAYRIALSRVLSQSDAEADAHLRTLRQPPASPA